MHRSFCGAGALLFACACQISDGSLSPKGEPVSDAPSSSASASTRYDRVDLGTLGGVSSHATDISDGGLVVGSSETADGATRGFRWTASGGMVELSPLPGHAKSEAIAVLDGGVFGSASILGVSGDDYAWTPVIWSSSGSAVAIPIPPLAGASSGLPGGFNARGEVVGMDYVSYGHGWIWSAQDGKYDLTANAPGGSNEGWANEIAASGTALVTTRAHTCSFPFNTTCWRTYLFDRASGYRSIGTPDGTENADVVGLGVNERGTVVGWTRNLSSQRAYKWDPHEGFTMLSIPSTESYSNGIAMAINAGGTVVGQGRVSSSGPLEAVVWPAGGGVISLNPDGEVSGLPMAVNSSGTVAGWGTGLGGLTHATIWVVARGPLQGARPSVASLRRKVPARSESCLTDPRVTVSKRTILACVADADRGRQ